MLEKQQIWILLSHSKSYCIWNRDDTQPSKTYFRENYTSFLSLSFFFGPRFFFFRKERRHLGIQGYLSLLRGMLLGELYTSSGIISTRHYQAYTHMHCDKPPDKRAYQAPVHSRKQRQIACEALKL